MKHPAVFACALFFAAALGAAAPERKSDPCSLLSGKEVQAVQGEKVASTKASEPASDRFAVSQCFYTLPTFSKSISLEVTRGRPGDAETPRAHWKQVFARALEKANEKEEEAEKRERGPGGGEREKEAFAKPRPIAGLGDEAFWVGTAMGGGLYVLKGDSYARLSVGGPEAEAVKIEKLKKLARQVLTRL